MAKARAIHTMGGRSVQLILLASLALSTNGANALEACGAPGSTDSLFKDGFDGTAIVTPYTYGGSSVTGSAPTVTITYPTVGASFAETQIPVAGTFTGPADTGIVINGMVAFTQGNNFLIPGVALAPGSNSLQATATNFQGATGQTSVSVSQSGAAPLVGFTTQNAVGFAPFKTTFSAIIQSGVTVSELRVDFNGDGTDDLTTSNPSAVLTYNYATAGTYIARLTIVDNTTPSPTTYFAYSRVMAQDLVEVRETLCGVYGYLRSQLATANVANAVLAFDPDRRNHYQTFFNSISAANLPVAASRLGNIANGLIHPEYAQLKVVKTFQGKLASFPMNFSRDENGVWRIDSL